MLCNRAYTWHRAQAVPEIGRDPAAYPPYRAFGGVMGLGCKKWQAFLSPKSSVLSPILNPPILSQDNKFH